MPREDNGIPQAAGGHDRARQTVEAENVLLERARAGESFALDRLLLLHSRALLNRIERELPDGLKRSGAAEDILQDTFTEAFRGIGSFAGDDGGKFFGWLATIAEHRTLDAIRRHKAAKRGGGRASLADQAAAEESAVLALLEMAVVHERTPSVSAAGREAMAAVRAAVSTLKPAYREAITLRYLNGLSVAETASRMGRTERAVHKLCARGVVCLRKSLGEPSRFLSQS